MTFVTGLEVVQKSGFLESRLWPEGLAGSPQTPDGRCTEPVILVLREAGFLGGSMPSLGRALRLRFLRRLLASGVLAFLCLASWFSRETNGLQATQTQPQTQTQSQPQSQSQASSTSANHAEQEGSGEMTIKEEPAAKAEEAATFRVNVRLVLARVVVRDARGHAVGNLNKEDFELLDNGKPQAISHFAVEHPGASPVAAAPSAPADTSQPAAKAISIPGRYFVYLFDDLHMEFLDIARTREAAEHRAENLPPTDRVAIFSTSGQTMLDFTDDRAKLHQTLAKLAPRSMFTVDTGGCPNIDLFMADMIVNKHDPEVTQTAINRYLDCSMTLGQGNAQKLAAASSFVQFAAQQVLTLGQEESRMTIGLLNDAVRRLSVMPGQKSLILVSPGFLIPQLENDCYDLIERALRAQVVIGTLDARGLYVTLPFGDASQAGTPDKDFRGQAFTPPSQLVLDDRKASAQADVLAVLANSTGGTFFHNNNDMDEGFRRVADAAESYYILGFTPQNLKMDGKFHTLKVDLKVHEKYDLQARRGYYAPNHAEDAAEEAKRDIQDELLSNEELHDLPVELHTQFFKPTDDTAKLTVLAHVDVKRLRYKKAEGRNENEVTIVMAVFDRNGNFLQGNQKLMEMRWKDETLQGKLGPGVTLKTSFDVKPGNYMVRLVARDSEEQLISAESGAVEIP